MTFSGRISVEGAAEAGSYSDELQPRPVWRAKYDHRSKPHGVCERSQMSEAYEVESRIARLSEIATLTSSPHVLDDTPVTRTGGAVAPRLHGQP